MGRLLRLLLARKFSQMHPVVVELFDFYFNSMEDFLALIIVANQVIKSKSEFEAVAPRKMFLIIIS